MLEATALSAHTLKKANVISVTNFYSVYIYICEYFLLLAMRNVFYPSGALMAKAKTQMPVKKFLLQNVMVHMFYTLFLAHTTHQSLGKALFALCFYNPSSMYRL